MKSVLLAGCGYVGGALASELIGSGNQVYALKRSSNNFLQSCTLVQADLSHQPPDLTALPALTHVVVSVSADSYTDEAYRSAYVLCLQNLLVSLRAIGFSGRVVLVSSTSVYAQSSGEWVDEQSQTEPTHFSGKRILEGEQHLRESGFDFVILRFSGIYGPGRERTIEQVADRSVRLPKGNAEFTNRIHQADCAGSIIHLLSLQSPDEIYIGSDSEPADRRTVLLWLAERLHVELTEADDSPHPLRGNKRCSNVRLSKSGYKFRYPSFREGYQELLLRR